MLALCYWLSALAVLALAYGDNLVFGLGSLLWVLLPSCSPRQLAVSPSGLLLLLTTGLPPTGYSSHFHCNRKAYRHSPTFLIVFVIAYTFFYKSHRLWPHPLCSSCQCTAICVACTISPCHAIGVFVQAGDSGSGRLTATQLSLYS